MTEKDEFPDFASSAPIREKREVITETDPATGVVTYEQWWKDDKLDRIDGPALIYRNVATAALVFDGWYKNGKRFTPSAEVRSAWLKRSGERIAPPSPAANPPVPEPG
jgi:hypothetical protein